jgi:ATP-dependent RNA helicase
MAEGIDRKADEKLEFVSSKEVSVAPTFEAMVRSPPMT